MVKHIAPVTQTGGVSFEYEDYVAARLLIDMLSAVAPFGQENGRVTQIDWQARDSDRLLDDLVITLSDDRVERTAELSIKSNRQVTSAGFPADFVETVWEQWFHTESTAFNHENDFLILVTGEIANEVTTAWKLLLRESIATTPDRMLARLKEPLPDDKGTQSSKTERALFKSLCCPEGLRDRGKIDDTATIEVIRRIQLIHFDFLSESSRDVARAVTDCQGILRSGSPTEASELWKELLHIASKKRGSGGSIELSDLLSQLRSKFALLNHPDYRSDWDAIERWSEERLGNIRTDIGGNLSLEREPDIDKIGVQLCDKRISLLSGESGSGKSALAKRLGKHRYKTTLLLNAELLETGFESDLQDSLKLQHSVLDVLGKHISSTLLVLDSIEHFSENGLRLLGTIVSEILGDENFNQVHILLTMPPEAIRRVITQFMNAGLEPANIPIHQLEFPDEVAVKTLLSEISGINWTALHRDLRPLLCNLKILDWVVSTVKTGHTMSEKVIGLPTLIEELWSRWIEDGRIERGGLLQKVASIEASSLSLGVPISRLDHGELQSLNEIPNDLLNRRNEKIYFAHDLVGDWARLRVLIGEDPTNSIEKLEKCLSTRWHRAVRLWGRWLLSQPDGVDKWSRALTRAKRHPDVGEVVHDLLLESLVLAENAEQLLETAWPVLTTKDGELLKRLLNRFLIVATMPDFRILSEVKNRAILPQLEAKFRIPIWSYWGATLRILDAHIDEICRIMPEQVPILCNMWLKETPMTTSSGKSPWRIHAARVALRIGRELQARSFEGANISDDATQAAYEAVLHSAVDNPDEAVQLALELACRRPLNSTTQSRKDTAERSQKEHAERMERENPELAELRGSRLPFIQGEPRGPWTDGPDGYIDEEFTKAILDSPAIISLARVRPNETAEILLAVCIEPPGYEDDFSFSGFHNSFGLETWLRNEPAMYYQGPFLKLLEISPQETVDLIIKLINFASERWREVETVQRKRRGPSPYEFLPDDELSIAISIEESNQVWIGDRRVFRWHLDAHVESKLIPCSLMALEKWLCDQIADGEDINHWLKQIMTKSKSIAFAGLLIDIGKLHPDYFLKSLRPLLGVASFYLWDPEIITQRSYYGLEFLDWNNQPESLRKLGRAWHKAEHRSLRLLHVAAELRMCSPDLNSFFTSCIEVWSEQVKKEPNLRLVIELLDKKNYRESPSGGPPQFIASSEFSEYTKRAMDGSDRALLLPLFAANCRNILSSEESFPPEEVKEFWDELTSISELPSNDKDELRYQADCLAGGIAVLFRFKWDWLNEDETRLKKCIEYFIEIANNPPPRRLYSLPDYSGDDGWECFLGEASVCLLPHYPELPLVRQMVALGVTGYHYVTTQKIMETAFEIRDSLSDDFEMMQWVGLRWSVIRRLRDETHHYFTQVKKRAERPEVQSASSQLEKALEHEASRWDEEYDKLIKQFISGEVQPMTVQEAGSWGHQELDLLKELRYPNNKSHAPRSQQSWHRRKRKRKGYGIDIHVLPRVLNWIDVGTAKTSEERNLQVEVLNELLNLLLDSLNTPLDTDEEFDDVDGFPNELDTWIFGQLSRLIMLLPENLDVSRYWKPILSLQSDSTQWTEAFLWSWFVEAFETRPSDVVFAKRWEDILVFALDSPEWDPSVVSSHRIDNKVCELLGCKTGLRSFGKRSDFAPVLTSMIEIYEQVAQRWFTLPAVVSSFTRALSEPAFTGLLCSGLCWIRNALIAPGKEDIWRERHFESHLVTALTIAWERHKSSITEDSELQSAFHALLTLLIARGNTAAVQLRDRVVDSAQ